MRKYNILFLDEDEYYLNNLMNYITEMYSDKIIAESISKKELFHALLKEDRKIDLIAASESFYENCINNLRDKNVVLLTNKVSDRNNLQCINKYQSVKIICEKLLDTCIQSKSINEKDTKVIIFYSPVGGIGTTTISLSIAEKIALSSENVLYISLEDSQSLGLYLSAEKRKYNFSDVILSIRNNGNNFYDILEEAVSSYNNTSLHYLWGVDSILDLEELNVDDIRELLTKIKEKKFYDYLIFEVPSFFNTKYYNLFKESNSVIEIMGQDSLSAYKVDNLLKQFDEISNFKFLVNKYDKRREIVMPEVVSKNLLPVIKTIPYYKAIEGADSLSSIKERTREFLSYIDEIIHYIK